ncbi:MAG: MBOAT family protein [Candidatus Cloacimonetes bacterium]|nr:MBOAT family protein [Candidatus Cloacimonadota bacterium]
MLFNSLRYLIFFPVIVFLYYLLPHKYRWALLLAASYYFYMCWRVEYALLIVTSTLVDYAAGILMSKESEKRKRGKYLALSLLVNLGLLFVFKYYNFVSINLINLFADYNIFLNMPELKILLPVGISFYTFQTLSYTIDIYKGRRRAERHLGIFALYVAFFPQLVAGPIERSTHLLPQFRQQHQFRYRNVSDGLKLMLWGFFKKVVIADRLALLVNTIYRDPEHYSGFPLLIAVYFFSFQIFCDFSAYSDIAVGSARVLGYDLTENFHRPYFARNIKEFWHRWHISLTSWFRDYVFIPLGGNRVSPLQFYYNIIVVFLLSAFWHGANWTFLFWGFLHGIYYIFTDLIERLNSKFFHLNIQNRVIKLFDVLLTFHLVTFAWIFFRAGSLNKAFLIIRKISSGIKINWQDAWGLTTIQLTIALVSLAIMLGVQIFQEKRGSLREYILRYPLMVRYGIYLALIIYIFSAGLFTNDKFLYFQF